MTPLPPPRPARSLTGLFAEVCARRREHVAVVCGSEQLTYGDLDTRARALAAVLVARGVARGDMVGLQVRRTHEVPIAVLGILLAGAAYVPLDPAYPAERLRFIAEETAIRCVVGDPGENLGVTVEHRVPVDGAIATDEHRTRSEGLPELSGDDLAYVIYTSGSTGQPKGCVVTHGNVMSLLSSALPMFEVDDQDRWSLLHSVAFDFSVWELWGAFATGATAVVVDTDTVVDLDLLLQLLSRERVTVLNQVPSYFRALVDAAAHAPDLPFYLRYLVFGGEPVDLAATSAFLDALPNKQRPTAVNMYGITETTVHVTHKELDRATLTGSVRSPIGRPLGHLQVELRDDDGAPVATGEVGEMWVSGDGVVPGYIARPELTAQRFVVTDGVRRYRSGDLARELPNGELEYLGRTDRQVKLRGVRIELAEVEAALRRCTGVRDAVVELRTQRRVGDVLFATVVVDGPFDVGRLRDECSTMVPPPYVPARFERVDRMPLTASGKVDRAAVAGPGRQPGHRFR